MTTTSIRDKIKERLQRNKRYAARFVTDDHISMVQDKTTDDIIKIVTEIIDEKIQTLKNVKKQNKTREENIVIQVAEVALKALKRELEK